MQVHQPLYMPKKISLGYVHEHVVSQILRLLLASCLESSPGRLTESCVRLMAGFYDNQCGFFNVPLEEEILFFCCKHHVCLFVLTGVASKTKHGWTAFTWKLVLHVCISTCLFFGLWQRHIVMHIACLSDDNLPQIQITSLFFLNENSIGLTHCYKIIFLEKPC